MGYSKTLEMGDSFEVGGSLTWQHSITTAPANYSLGSITLPAIASPLRSVYIDLIYQSLMNSNAAINYVETDCYLVVDYTGTQTNALALPAGSLWCMAGDTNRHLPGSRIYGNTDVKAEFTSGGTVTVGIVGLEAHQNNLYISGVQPVARVILI